MSCFPTKVEVLPVFVEDGEDESLHFTLVKIGTLFVALNIELTRIDVQGVSQVQRQSIVKEI